jgi:hypothetical protein
LVPIAFLPERLGGIRRGKKMTIRREARETLHYEIIIHYTGCSHQTTPSKHHELALWKAIFFFHPSFIWPLAKYAHEVDNTEKNSKGRIRIVDEDSSDR